MNAGHRFNRKMKTGSRPSVKYIKNKKQHTLTPTLMLLKWNGKFTNHIGIGYWKLFDCFVSLVVWFRRGKEREIDAKIPIHDSHLTTRYKYNKIHSTPAGKETENKKWIQIDYFLISLP